MNLMNLVIQVQARRNREAKTARREEYANALVDGAEATGPVSLPGWNQDSKDTFWTTMDNETYAKIA